MTIKEPHADNGINSQEHDDILVSLLNEGVWVEWAKKIDLYRYRQTELEDVHRECPLKSDIQKDQWEGPEIQLTAEVPIGRGEGKYYSIVGYADLVISYDFTRDYWCPAPAYHMVVHPRYDRELMQWVDDPPVSELKHPCNACGLSKGKKTSAYWDTVIACEIKSSKEPSLGSVIRQISGYKKFSNYRHWVVVSPFGEWAKILKGQNIEWINALTVSGQSELDIGMVLF